MKKLFAFISLLLATTAMIFADVTVKKLDNGTAEVTFFYGNPRATEVLLAGDFNNWQNGAEAMTKTDKGFTITKIFKVTDELRYKFISDGNWTTDLKAPDFVDDGFGGKNSHVVIADMLGGDDDAAASKAKINFVSWTMFGVQGNYLTQSVNDPAKKGLDLDSVTVGAKSYNKFVGNFLPNCPVYIEIAMAETEMEDAGHDGNGGNRRNYIYQKNNFNSESKDIATGLKEFVSGMLFNPVYYLAQGNNNKGSSEGPGTNPFLGHFKFGFNTPYVNFLTGFNYAKPDVRNAITWTTISSSWDAGYQHTGGFNIFSLGSKAQAALEDVTGLVWDIGFAPNRTADRKGYRYGYWGWIGFSKDDLVVDLQSNGMYAGDYAFYDPVEHDFIVGVKDKIGGFSFALQGLLATNQKSSEEIIAIPQEDGDAGMSAFFGHSTDVFYRTGNIDGIQNFAANAQVGYKAENFGVNAEYRFRGAQASMLYVREDQDDGDFLLSDQLGVLNSQNVSLNAWVKPLDALKIDLGVSATLPLETINSDSEFVTNYIAHSGTWDGWYAARCADDMAPLFGVTGGTELVFKPAASYAFEDLDLTLGLYADMKLNLYTLDSDDKTKFGKKYIGDTYSASDSKFLFKQAGLSANWNLDNDAVKAVNVYYGFDNSNSARLLNSLIGQVEFPYSIKATLAFALKNVKDTEAGKAFNEDANNPFGFAVGVSKQFKAAKKPTLYAQFVFNTDPFASFGSGQDNLRLDRANIGRFWVDGINQGQSKDDPVDWYDGRAALRVGIRWDI